jgi:predicted MFS family arabinose efflux permease
MRRDTDAKEVFWGVYFAFYYVGSFGRSTIHLSYAEAVNLLIVLNSMGVFGRLGPNFVADRYLGPQNTLIPIVAITSLLLFCWIRVSSRGGLYAWVIIYGIVGAAIQSLFPAALSSLTTDLRMAGTRMGMVFTVVSFAVLTGPPIAGQLIQKKGGGYEYAQLFAGADMLVGCCLLIVARYSSNRKLMVRI